MKRMIKGLALAWLSVVLMALSMGAAEKFIEMVAL